MAKDYSKLEKDDLLKVIEKLESRKKYGLIWDEEKTKERFEKESENALPVLKEVKGKEIKTDANKPTNILIEGDNYHSLSVLNYTHQGKVDVIYIDPPYNTGNKDFKYNDNFVEKDDAYRHSKWLSFIGKRLQIAKSLLKNDGAIFISIDDNEFAQLKLLCDDIFGEDNFVDCISWDKKSSAKGVPPKNMVVNVHEYILVYQINSSFSFIGEPRNLSGFSNPDNDPRGPWRNTNIKSTVKDKSLAFTITDPETKIIYTDTWAFSKNELERLIEEKYLIFPKNKDGQVRRKEFFNEFKNSNIPIKSSWGLFDNQKNTEMLKKILPNVTFLNPKPIELMKYLLKAVAKNNAIILDFMAGSGTTGHAVLELNKEDGGSRQFILCTNNELNGFEKELREQGLSEKEIQEHGICRRVTYPRIEKTIKGYKTPKGEKIDGLGGNLKYFKTAFFKDSISRDDLKLRITRECTEMLCLREGIFDEVKVKPDYHIFEQNGRIMAVYYALEQNGLEQLKKELDKMKGEKILYCFTLDPLGLDKKNFAGWEGVNFEAIPQPILDIYKEIYNL